MMAVSLQGQKTPVCLEEGHCTPPTQAIEAFARRSIRQTSHKRTSLEPKVHQSAAGRKMHLVPSTCAGSTKTQRAIMNYVPSPLERYTAQIPTRYLN